MTTPELGFIETIIVFDGPWDMGSFLDGDLDTYLDQLRRKVPTTTKANGDLFISRLDWCLLLAVGEEGGLIRWPWKEGKVGQLVLADPRIEPWATRRVEAAQWVETKQQLRYEGLPTVPNPAVPWQRLYAAPGQMIYYGPPPTPAPPQWLPPQPPWPPLTIPPNDQLRLGDPPPMYVEVLEQEDRERARALLGAWRTAEHRDTDLPPGTLVEVPIGEERRPTGLHERWWRRLWLRPWNRREEY